MVKPRYKVGDVLIPLNSNYYSNYKEMRITKIDLAYSPQGLYFWEVKHKENISFVDLGFNTDIEYLERHTILNTPASRVLFSKNND